jgi:hypothetical protein
MWRYLVFKVPTQPIPWQCSNEDPQAYPSTMYDPLSASNEGKSTLEMVLNNLTKLRFCIHEYGVKQSNQQSSHHP